MIKTTGRGHDGAVVFVLGLSHRDLDTLKAEPHQYVMTPRLDTGELYRLVLLTEETNEKLLMSQCLAMLPRDRITANHLDELPMTPGGGVETDNGDGSPRQ